MSELDFWTSISIKFQNLDNEASKEIKNKFLAYLDSYLKSSNVECIGDEDVSVEIEIFSSPTPNDISKWFENQLTDNASDLSKNAINHLKNSAISGHGMVNDHPFYYLIRKELGETKLNWHKHVDYHLADALIILKALELRPNQSMSVGNGVVITLLSKDFSRRPKKVEFNITSKDHFFIITLQISQPRGSEYKNIYFSYFECSGEVFEDAYDCIHLPYLVDEMMCNLVVNDHHQKIDTKCFEHGTKLKVSLKQRRQFKRDFEVRQLEIEEVEPHRNGFWQV